jgi:hypothetical protein
VGRIQSWQNQWGQTGFLMQIVCLTIAPAFMAGGIYLCLRRVVYAFGPENSRISPEAYTRIVRPLSLSSCRHELTMITTVHPMRSRLPPASSRRRWPCLNRLTFKQVRRTW